MGFFYSQFFVTPEYPTHSFKDQTIIVTGSNVGLGLEAARHFVRLNAATVILAVRNRRAGEAAKASIRESHPDSQTAIEVWDLDLASYASVITFAEKVSQLPRLDVLLCNASIATEDFQLAEGRERSITVNVISTILLGLLVLPTLRRSAEKYGTKPRLTTVVSEVHAWTKFAERNAENTFAALDDEKQINMGERYATSKLLQVLILREIAARMRGDSIVVNMLNPGLCHSQLARDLGIRLALMKMVLARSTEVGSRTLVAGAAAGDESHGAYMTDGKVDNGALSDFVRSEEGKRVQEKVWGELREILERIEPGVTSNL
jgi:NAD(P)-dependent dehydrogenase (short-subunit alcohol dehydrogenase family)